MSFKPLLAIIIPVFMAASASAQDRIFQSNGNVIKARVTSVTADNVTYKLWQHQDGPEYSIAKGEVDKIKYESGKQEWFSKNNDGEGSSNSSLHEIGSTGGRKKMAFGKNLLAFAPIQLTEGGVGFAINYERAIDKDGIVSFNLPFVSAFNMNNNNGYSGNYPNNYNANNNHEDAMFYFCPGIKFYPTSMYGRVKYAIGPSLVLGAGQETSYNDFSIYSYPYYSTGYMTRDKLMMGIMITNSLSINPTPHFYMGIDLGLGFTYVNRLDNVNQSMSGISQFAFKLGYRF